MQARPEGSFVEPVVDWSRLTPKQADELAYRAMSEWPRSASFDAVHEGMDLEPLLRWALWDKVSRAVRALRYPGEAPQERALLALPLELRAPAPTGRDRRRTRLRRRVSGVLREGERTVRQLLSRRRGERPLFVPHSLYRWSRTPKCFPASARFGAPNFSHGASRDDALLSSLLEGITRGLGRSGLVLQPEDQLRLGAQARTSLELYRRAELELRSSNPAAVVLFAENHSPAVEYCLAGRRLGIPVVALQHGLDCEYLVLDDAFADSYALWSDERRGRYLRASRRRPRLLEVTGYPEHDALRLPRRLDSSGHGLLWVGRPHHPSKCYTPSRRPAEGSNLLRCLSRAASDLGRGPLVVRPHPYDFTLMQQWLDELPRAERGLVTLSAQPVERLMARARVVLTEDSTAGLDAMFLGKPLVHVGLGDRPPVVPFVESGAALGGFSEDELRSSLARITSFGPAEQALMLEGQRCFLRAHAGPCDGRAGARLSAFLKELV